MNKIDPVCGMHVDIEKAKSGRLISIKNGKKYYFCSMHCKNTFENRKNKKWYKSEKFSKIFPFVLAFILITGTVLSIVFDFMLLYMGLFFIVFSIFKMPDWKGFVVAYKQYDLIARYVKGYALIYPAMEFILGVLYLINNYFDFYLIIISYITLIIMLVGALGVAIKLAKREKFQCACLGTWLNVPLTKVTLLEDLLMASMAILIIIGF
mgnify:CR=1 FL=1